MNAHAFNKRHIEGLKNYPVKDGGWLSPNGDYYPCPHRNHDSITPLLTMAWYGTDAGRRVLEDRDWVLVKHDGVVWFEGVTRAQVNRMALLLPLSPTPAYWGNLNMGISKALAKLDGHAFHWQEYAKEKTVR